MAASPVSVSTDIASDPKLVYDLISDLPRMGEWSPENRGGKWRGGATGPEVGAKFKGKNKIGWRSWSTDVVVTDAAPAEKFAFKCSALGMPIAVWTYDITPTATGCTVTESFVDTRSGFLKVAGSLATGVKDRDAHNLPCMETTLANLKKAAEAS
ncbi:SRPBCC family protein [Sporichthya sp.]|uniref:SRPBCC family protein n=1 Tax=Sporichthya sp. TaxID=65475 RepID=UPI00181D5B0C|nr:SRPBCC family protein [Sporichthya sp.]MBA3744198.1 SRPBCC family protein [Sporichthya sp.]